MNLWTLIRLFLRLAIVEGEPDPKDAADEGAGDATLDDLIDAEDPPGDGAPGDGADADAEPPAISAAKKREKELETELADERRFRREAEARARPAPTPAKDPDFDREEEQLRQLRANGTSAEQIQWAEWKISVDRTARAARSEATQARAEARDRDDRAEFREFKRDEPGLYKRYADRVEEEAKKYPGVSRMAILRLLLGDDTLKAKTQAKAAGKAPPPKVDRGTPPRGRSDVGGKGGKSTSVKTKRDWANTPI